MHYVGFGYDVHQLKEGRNLILGGIHIPHHKGSFGHSDADVLIHAICDALLGAANLGDIGKHFPDTDNKYKDIDSNILLEKVMEMILVEGYVLQNIDTTICLQKPKIADYIPQMKEKLSKTLQCKRVSIKATTTEKLGFIGREEGISASCICMIKQKEA
jgi:2-C-methyl-D-erythritol 2,4-cyclodiphosphate synthase